MNNKNRFKILPFKLYLLKYLIREKSLVEQEWVMFPGRSIIVYDRMTDTIWIEAEGRSYLFVDQPYEIEMFRYTMKLANHKWLRQEEYMNIRAILRSKSMPRNIDSLLRDKLDTDYAVKYNDSIRHRRSTLFFNQYSCCSL